MTAPQQDYKFSRRGRSQGTLLAVTAWLALLAILALYLHAALWLLVALTLPLLPALWELWQNPISTLHLSQDRVAWANGPHHDHARLADIAKARFDTRWDFSVRVTLILHSGHNLRLPPQVLPPHRQFETKLQLHGVVTERQHFTAF